MCNDTRADKSHPDFLPYWSNLWRKDPVEFEHQAREVLASMPPVLDGMQRRMRQLKWHLHMERAMGNDSVTTLVRLHQVQLERVNVDKSHMNLRAAAMLAGVTRNFYDLCKDIMRGLENSEPGKVLVSETAPVLADDSRQKAPVIPLFKK